MAARSSSMARSDYITVRDETARIYFFAGRRKIERLEQLRRTPSA
jgi:hypothetical protein